MIEVVDLKKKYTPKKGTPVMALNGISLKFPEKGLVFILGKSGCGKSTLLNMIGGMDKVDSGDIIIKGKSTKDFTQAELDSYRNTYLGFIFQEYNILNEFTVGANIALALELQGKKATNEKINEILKMVDLEGFAHRKPMQLSGGQKQRVAIARALVKNPQVILADEPTGALDSKSGIGVFDTLKKLSQDKLVIVVSHDREFAESYGDRVIELKDGQVISDIEKYKEKSEKKNESISIVNNKIIQIEKGYELTQEDVDMINAYLKNNEAFISLDEKSNRDIKKFARIDDNGDQDCFKETNENEIVYNNKDNFKLIKSRLPFRDSFKMGASSLRAKPFRLIVAIFLAVVAFTLFGLADTIASYNKYTCTVTTIENNNLDSFVFEKNTTSDLDSDYLYYNNAHIEDKDINYLKEKTGIEFYKVYNIGLDVWSRLNNQPSYNSLSSGERLVMSNYQFVLYDSLKDMNYTLYGQEPENGDEIVITKVLYDFFDKYGYDKHQGNTINSVEDFFALNPTLNVSGYNYKVVGIVDTKFDVSKYNKSYTTDNGILEALIEQYTYYEFSSSFTGKFFGSSKFLEEYETNTLNKLETSDGAIGKMPTDKNSLKNLVKFSYDDTGYKEGNLINYFKMRTSFTDSLDMLNSTFEYMEEVFMWIGIVFAVFAGLLLMNYIATSISFKKQEIGILRAVGAKASDVFGIFFSEAFIIAFIDYILSVVATIFIALKINSIMNSEYNLGIEFLSFGVRQIIVMFALCIGVSFVSSAIPVFMIARKRPIEAIRSI
jgi:putative ABC transport system permease protein